MEPLNSILERFKIKNPEILALKPNIEIYELLDNEGNPTGKIKIGIERPFIFDQRLIPKIFESITVEDYTIGKTPKEFKGSNASLPWFEIFSPANYQNYVDHNLELIRGKLNKPKWKKEEILNALTGNYKDYAKKCDKAKQNMLNAHKDDIFFFKSC